ncbi:hypothetical protein AB0C76_36290 [Kitasatospora sp. NPDC048722]
MTRFLRAEVEMSDVVLPLRPTPAYVTLATSAALALARYAGTSAGVGAR